MEGSKALMIEDIRRLDALADMMIISFHWDVSNTTAPASTRRLSFIMALRDIKIRSISWVPSWRDDDGFVRLRDPNGGKGRDYSVACNLWTKEVQPLHWWERRLSFSDPWMIQLPTASGVRWNDRPFLTAEVSSDFFEKHLYFSHLQRSDLNKIKPVLFFFLQKRNE